MDHIDKIVAQWKEERPDLDTEAMALIGRLKRLGQHLSVEMGKTFAGYNLNNASFDVLATLLRSGDPYALAPTVLMKTMMITSGTMTNRIDQLQRVQLVERVKNPEDGRSFLIRLTSKGLSLINEAVKAHVATQHTLVGELEIEEREQLNDLLRRFLSGFEG
jgi:DNA-binding MarR family transcriptional regulator